MKSWSDQQQDQDNEHYFNHKLMKSWSDQQQDQDNEHDFNHKFKMFF